VRWFIATYENKLQHAAFLLPALAPHPTEPSKVFQAGCFNFAQMKASVELCINKLSYAAAKVVRKTNCEKFDSEKGNLECRNVWLTHACQAQSRVKGKRKKSRWGPLISASI